MLQQKGGKLIRNCSQTLKIKYNVQEKARVNQSYTCRISLSDLLTLTPFYVRKQELLSDICGRFVSTPPRMATVC